MDKKQLIEILSLPCTVNDLRIALLEYFKEEYKTEEMNYRYLFHEIGEIFEMNKKKFQVIALDDCHKCSFCGFYGDCNCLYLNCSYGKRPDGKSVVYVEVQE